MTTPNQVSEWLRLYPGHLDSNAQGFLLERSSAGKITANIVQVPFDHCDSWLNDRPIAATGPDPNPSTPCTEEKTHSVPTITSSWILRLIIIKTLEKNETVYTASTPRGAQASWLQNLHISTLLPQTGLAAFCKGKTRFEARHHLADARKETLRSSSDFVVSMATLGLTWNYSRTTRKVKGIIVNRDPFVTNSNLASLFRSYLLLMQEPLCLGFCILQWRIENFGAGEYGLEGVNHNIKEIEDDTGAVPYLNAQAQGNVFAGEDLLYRNKNLLQRLKRAKRTALEIEHKLANNRHCLAFLVRTNIRLLSLGEESGDREQVKTRTSPLTEKFNTLHDTLNIFTAEINWCKDRIANQVSAIEQVTSNRDSFLSIQIARDTRRDGLSLITLAVVTLLFLPGTFVASLFTVPIFDWNPGLAGHLPRVLSDRSWIFGVVAGSLTAAVLVFWFVWFLLKRKWEREEDKSEEVTV